MAAVPAAAARARATPLSTGLPQPVPARPVYRRLLILGLLAFAIRLAVVCCVYRDLPASADHNAFGWEQGWIARSIFLHHGFSSPFQPLDDVPTALVAPLYPYLLAVIFRIFGLYTNAAAFVSLGLNAFVSASVVLPVFLMARHAVGTRGERPRTATRGLPMPALLSDERWTRRIPWIAATLWALYPFAIYYSGSYLWDCTLTGALFAWTFCFSLRLRRYRATGWGLWGLLYGVTALCNPSVLSLFPAIVLIQVIGRGMRVRSGLLRVVAACSMLALPLLPWTIRNVHTLHASIPMRDGYWLEFYAGNNADTSHSNPAWAHPASNPVELRRYEQLGEIAYMSEKESLALSYVTAHPGQFAFACVRRFTRFWTGFWSFSSAYLANEPLDVPNVPFCTVLTAFMLVGMQVLLRQHRRPAISFLAVLFIFPLPYYLTHASMDYRQPIEPEIVVVIAFGAAAMVRRIQVKRAERTQAQRQVLIAG